MINKIFLSTLFLMKGLISTTLACEAMSETPIIHYKDCSDNIAKKFKARAANIKTIDQKQREADLNHLIEIAKHEQQRCKETCIDAPQKAAGR